MRLLCGCYAVDTLLLCGCYVGAAVRSSDLHPAEVLFVQLGDGAAQRLGELRDELVAKLL